MPSHFDQRGIHAAQAFAMLPVHCQIAPTRNAHGKRWRMQHTAASLQHVQQMTLCQGLNKLQKLTLLQKALSLWKN